MTKQRHCFVTQVGDAIEKLASALDPERRPPFKGDILDLLEWAERDVLELRKQLDARDHFVPDTFDGNDICDAWAGLPVEFFNPGPNFGCLK